MFRDKQTSFLEMVRDIQTNFIEFIIDTKTTLKEVVGESLEEILGNHLNLKLCIDCFCHGEGEARPNKFPFSIEIIDRHFLQLSSFTIYTVIFIKHENSLKMNGSSKNNV